jgi:hypothetical protein
MRAFSLNLSTMSLMRVTLSLFRRLLRRAMNLPFCSMDHHVVVPGAEAVVDVQALVLADTDDGVLFNLVLAGVGDGVGGD